MKTTAPKDKPLTKKQAAFVKELVDDPKMSGTQAALKTYGRGDKELSPVTAASIAYENLRKPQIVSKLGNYNQLVESALIGTLEDYKESDKVSERSLSVDIAKYVHDKIHGKATQRMEVQTNKVSINIDLTSSQEPTG